MPSTELRGRLFLAYLSPGLLGLGLLLYLYFPFLFRAALIGGPVLVYFYLYGENPNSQTKTNSNHQQSFSAHKEDQQVRALDSEKTVLVQSAALSPPAAALTAAAPITPANQASSSKPVAGNDSMSVVEDAPSRYIDAQGVSPGARAMAAAMSAKAAQKSQPKEVVVLYGSQLGCAMEIAKDINAEAASHGIPSKVYAMNDFPFSKLPSVGVAIFVVSSTGDGDPPENCQTFFNTIRYRTHSSTMLSGLQYTVCGLGDSNYTRFMQVPRVFTTRLPELGARCFYKCCEADEVDGLEDIVDAWFSGIWEPLKEALAAEPLSIADNVTIESDGGAKEEEVELVGVPALQPCRVKLQDWVEGEIQPAFHVNTANGKSDGNQESELFHSASLPFHAPVSRAKYLTASWSDRVVIDLEVDISGSGIKFRPGDSIGVVPQNDTEIVDKLMQRLSVDENRRFRIHPLDDEDGGVEALSHIKQPCTLRQALLHYVDITAVPRKGLLRVLAEYCLDHKEKTKLLFLSSRGGKDAYKTNIQDERPGLLDLLLSYPSCNPDLAHLLDTLPPLVARFYSITNSPAVDPNHIQVAFSVVKVKMPKDRLFQGVATNWMERCLAIGPNREWVPTSVPVQLPVFHKGGGEFHPPPSLDSPLIMIGPGTGVCPFRGFLQERRALLRERGEGGLREGADAWLFFGCRREDEDYLFREDFEAFEADKTLTKMVVAFSRAQTEKVYVQHKLKEYGSEVYSLLRHPQAYIFVCGDGAHMAKDVHATLLSIMAEHGNMTESLAVSYLAVMTSDKRYIRDIWS